MKNGLFKKSMSVFLAMLMLLTCWVWVAPTEAEAADSNSPTAVINTSKISGLSEASFNNALKYTAISGKFHGDDATTTANKGYFKNVLYSPHYGTDVKNGYAVSFGRLNDNKADGARVWYPETTLIYDDPDTTPQIGILFDIDSTTTKSVIGRVNGVKVKVNQVYMSDNADGLSIPSDFWMLKSTVSDKASDTTYYTHFTFNYILDNLQSTSYVGTRSDKSNGSQCAKNGGWDIYAAYLQYTGGAFGSGNTYYKAIKPKWKITTENAGENTVQAEKTIYVIDVVPLKDALDGAKKLYNSIESDPGRYTPSSVASFVTMANNLISAANVGNYINSTDNKVTDWNTAVSSALSAYNSFKLEERTFEVTYENLFSLSDWYNAAGGATTNRGGSIIADLDAGTLSIECPSGADHDNNYVTWDYDITIEKNTDYIFEYSADIEDGGVQVHLFLNEGKDVVDSWGTFPDDCYIHKGTTSDTVAFNSKGYDNINIRFGTVNADNITNTFSNIRLYKASRQAEVDAVKASGLNRKVYSYNESVGTLPTPTRTGYKFNGWVDADGNAVSGTVTESKTVYSTWTINQYTITFDTDGGSAIAPITQDYGTAVTAPANPTKTNYKFVGWDQAIPSTMPAQDMTIKAQWVEDTFTIKFVNHDGTVLQESNVVNGTMPVYNGKTPTKAYDETNHYTFSGWSPAVSAVTGEATYTAQFKPVAHTFEYSNLSGDAHSVGCSSCSYSATEVHSGNTKTYKEKIEPTCNQAGTYKYEIKCDKCKEVYQRGSDTIAATGEHTYGAWTSAGEQNHEKSCTCGDTKTEAHTWTGWVAVSSNTNDAAGQMKNTCNTCGYELTTTCNYSVEADVPSTCYSQGYTTYKCIDCGHDYTVTKALAAHTPAAAVTENKTDSTCYAEGSYDSVVYCSVAECHAELSKTTETIAKKEHTPAAAVEENKTDSTCYATGSYDSVVYCSVAECHAELSKTTETIAKKEHTPAEAVVENKVDSSCYATGSYDSVVYCSVEECHAKLSSEKVTIEKKDHTPAAAVRENEVAPTCITDGSYDLVVYCSVEACKALISRTPTVDRATGKHIYGAWTPVDANSHERVCTADKKCTEVETASHNWSGWVADPENNADNNGAMKNTCSDCGYVWTASCVYEVEEDVPSTCYSQGYTTYKCKEADCSNGYTVMKDFAEHTAGEAVVENKVDSSCYAEGSYDEVVYCSVEACKHEISRTEKTIEKKEHTPAEAITENKVDSTCYAEGSYDEVVYCSVCATDGRTYQISRDKKTIAKKAHTPAVAVRENEVDSSCYAEGSYDSVVYCSVCTAAGKTEELSRETKTIAKKAHTPAAAVEENKNDSTCYAEGSYDEVVYCSVEACKYEISRTGKTIEKKAHTAGEAVVENKVDSTCTAEGSYDEVVYCSVCAAVDEKTEISRTPKTIEKKAHTAGEVVVENKVDATCTVDGSYENVTYCTVCSTETSRVTITVTAPGHTLTQVDAKAPTCTEAGYDAYVHCTACDYTTYVEIPANGHTNGSVVVENEKDATCVSPKSYDNVTYCTVCKVETSRETITVEGTGGGHDWTDATCTTPKTCKVCYATEGEALGHSYGAAPEIVPATCYREKMYIYKCRYCSEPRIEGGAEIVGGAHTGVIVPTGTVEATCEENGVRSYICLDCGMTVRTEIIEKLGHTDKDGNGECDNCKGSYQGNTVCGCICHKQSGFMKFLYKIALFFWKLFGIGKSCGCGTVHY